MRVLTTGAAGMLGATLVERWHKKFNLYASDKSNFTGNRAKEFMAFDLLSKSYDKLMDWAKPDIIIHCAAITNVDYCEEHPEKAQAVNAESVKKFLQSGRQFKLVFISSDSVFPDGKHLATEEDKTSPKNIYGKSKVSGEKFILNAGEPHLILRTTIVGTNINPRAKGFVEWMLNAVKDGNVITLFDDVLFTPITIWHLADELEWIIKNKISGLIHVAGSEPISKYEFGIRICRRLGLDTDLIQKASIDNIKFRAKRSKDQTLDSSYYQSMSNRVMPPVENTIEYIVQNFEEIANE